MIKIESREEDTGDRTSRVPKPGRLYPKLRVDELDQIVLPVSVDQQLSEIDFYLLGLSQQLGYNDNTMIIFSLSSASFQLKKLRSSSCFNQGILIQSYYLGQFYTIAIQTTF